MIGTRLGPCKIAARLGAGGMAYRAADTKLGREVAIVGADSGACAPPGLA